MPEISPCHSVNAVGRGCLWASAVGSAMEKPASDCEVNPAVNLGLILKGGRSLQGWGPAEQHVSDLWGLRASHRVAFSGQS